MRIQLNDENKFAVLAVSGEIDLHGSPDVRREMMGVLDKQRDLLVDLSEVSYVDSSAIACLVEGLQHAKGKGLGFGLAGIREAVMDVLRLTRLDGAFSIYSSVEAARKANDLRPD